MKHLIKKIIITTSIVIFGVSAIIAENISNNDGSAFITKAEFDALKSSFQSQIDTYNNAIDSKIDTAIASYLSGIRVSKEQNLTLPTTQKVFRTFDKTNFPWVDGKHDLFRLQAFITSFASGREINYPANHDGYLVTSQEPDKNAKAAFINQKNIGGSNRPIYMGYAENWNFVAKTVGDIDTLYYSANANSTSNLNRYNIIRGVNRLTFQQGRSSPGSIRVSGSSFTNKADNISTFNTSYYPQIYMTTTPSEAFREGCMYLYPKPDDPWEITAYDTRDKLVSVYSKFTPDFCYSFTGKPNNLKYEFFDVNNADSAIRQTNIDKAFAEMQKWTIETCVSGWEFVKATNSESTYVYNGVGNITFFKNTPSANKIHIIPTWTTAQANSWYYGIYWPKPWSDNVYLPNTEKLWTDEYSNIANKNDFKSIVGSENVCQYISEGTTTNYYNMTAGLVLNYGEEKGTMTVKFKNNGSKALKVYIMKNPLDVNTGYVKANIIETDKSNTSSKNEIDIAAGATKEVNFEKDQNLILFSFHGVNGSGTDSGVLEVQEMKIKLEG